MLVFLPNSPFSSNISQRANSWLDGPNDSTFPHAWGEVISDRMIQSTPLL